MAASKQRGGLVSYGGDSEVSDSEIDEENMSFTSSPPNDLVIPQLMANSLGIGASSKPRTPSSPPSFVKPVVHSAPLALGGLVAHYGDEEDEHNESAEMESSMNEVFAPQQPTEDEVQELDQKEDKLESSPPLPELVEDTQPLEETTSQESENQPPSGPLFLPLTNVYLPPEPSAPCSKALQEKVKTMLQKQAALGIDVNKTIQARKDFRNPSIYKKLIEFSNIDEFGTNYPEHLYNPHEWTEEDYYDNLSKAQKKAYEKKERAKLERSKVEFVTGTKRPNTGQGLLGAHPSADQSKKRKTKWDKGADGGSRGTSPSGSRPPLLGAGPVGAQAKVQASLMNIS